MSAVFSVYGIGVDYRHLTVIADYMVSFLVRSFPTISQSLTVTCTHRRAKVDTNLSTELVSRTTLLPSSKLLSKLPPISLPKQRFSEISTTWSDLQRGLSLVEHQRVVLVRLRSGVWSKQQREEKRKPFCRNFFHNLALSFYMQLLLSFESLFDA